MKNKKLFMLAAILMLAIGFASISTVLYLNGNAKIVANTDDYDVYFSKSVLDNEDVSSTTISSDGK